MRFPAETATYLVNCPECERPTSQIEPQLLVGFRLFDPLDLADIVADGLGASPGTPGPSGRRS
jgi:hypothetical protein